MPSEYETPENKYTGVTWEEVLGTVKRIVAGTATSAEKVRLIRNYIIYLEEKANEE